MHAARDAGAYGAKITGADGGCIVALTSDTVADTVTSAINDARRRASITNASGGGFVVRETFQPP